MIVAMSDVNGERVDVVVPDWVMEYAEYCVCMEHADLETKPVEEWLMKHHPEVLQVG